MAKYEALPTLSIQQNGVMLRAQQLPELVHLEDPALSVMTDFTVTPAHIILPTDNMDHAINEMEINGVHLLLVINESGHFQGIISSEDVWGEKPIQLIQERRVPRDQILVRALMVPYTQITALDYQLIKTVQVGHIVKTLLAHKQHYVLAVMPNAENHHIQTIRGIFTASQISKQLHKDINDVF